MNSARMLTTFAAFTFMTSLTASSFAASAKAEEDAAALKALDQKFSTDFAKKDLDGLMSYYADDAVVMDPGPSLWLRGKEEIRKSFNDFMVGIDSISFSIHDATYHTVGNIGYGYGLFDIGFTDKKTSQRVIQKGRFAAVFENRGGRWFGIVDHASFPLPAPQPPTETAPKQPPKATVAPISPP